MAEPKKEKIESEHRPPAHPSRPPPVPVSEGPSAWRIFLSAIAAKFPDLKKRLRQADMADEPVAFVAKTFTSAIILTAIVIVLLFMVFTTANINTLLLLPIVVVAFPLFFWYGLQVPRVKVEQKAREIDKDLIFACRHLLIELHAGVPLFDAMLHITRDYGEVSKIFSRILERINVGVPADVAMHDVSEEVPSAAMRRVILQLVNSLRSGSDVAAALDNILDQLSREQVIEIKSYGQKLSPLAMFYMIFGIIIPSLGVALAIILISFLSVPADAKLLAAAFVLLGLVQFIFISMIESSRPRFEV
ncbi:MAG: type II secretion system F family protein [Candidatus Micrarchaeia archaeon]